jgi:hypothetical protein
MLTIIKNLPTDEKIQYAVSAACWIGLGYILYSLRKEVKNHEPSGR